MSGLYKLYDFPEDAPEEKSTGYLEELLEMEFEQPDFLLPPIELPELPLEEHVDVEWERGLRQFNLEVDSLEWPNSMVGHSHDALSNEFEILPEADASYSVSVLYTTEIPSDKLAEAEPKLPSHLPKSSEDPKVGYVSDLLRHRHLLGEADDPFEPVEAPRNDRIIRAIRGMLKVWATAIGQNKEMGPQITNEIFTEFRGCKDIDGVRKVLAREDRKWLRDELRDLFRDQIFLTHALSHNPHLSHEDKTLLWQKLPALKTMVDEPAKILATWNPKRIDRAGNNEEAMKLIREGDATLEKLTEIVEAQYEQTRHLFESVKCSKKNNIYNFWNNAISKAFQQLKKQTVNKVLVEQIDEALGLLKGNRSLHGITASLKDRPALQWHLHTLHENFHLIELLLQERTNTLMIKNLLVSYPSVIKKLLEQ